MLPRPALIAAVLCFLAQPAWAATTMRDLAPCLDAVDRAVCLLKVAGQDRAGANLFQDADLAAHPEILAAAGFTEAGAERWKASSDAAPYRQFSGPHDEAGRAVWAALALDRAGRPPTEALAPITALEGDSPQLSPFFGESQTTSPQLLAYWLLAGDDDARPVDRHPTPALAAAARQAWEQELSRRGGIADLATGPLGLGMAYRAAGDEAGVDRAIRLVPTRRDDERIALLVRLGRLEQAAALSRTADVESIESEFRTEVAKLEAANGKLQAALEEYLDRNFGDMIAKLRARGNNEEADELEAAILKQADDAEPAAEEAESTSDAEIHAMAADALAEARIELVRAAAAAGRADLAREAADTVIANSKPALPYATTLAATPDLVVAASPSVALAWLEALEAGIRPYDRDGFDESHEIWERFRAVGSGWRRIGRADRFEALIARWRQAALVDVEAYREAMVRGQARQTPFANVIGLLLLEEDRVEEARPLFVFNLPALLENDIKRGRGVAHLDGYLSGATAPGAARSLLIYCSGAADLKRDFVSSFACLRRQAALAKTPVERGSVVSQALGSAASAARVGQLAISRELLTLALTTARGIPGPHEDPVGIRDSDLVEIAKAELSADGRLPPLAPSSER